MTYRGRVSNLLINVVDLGDRYLLHLVIHPVKRLDPLNKLLSDIGDDLVAQVLGSRRECSLDEEAAENPAQSFIDVSNTCFEAFRNSIRVLNPLIFEPSSDIYPGVN